MKNKLALIPLAMIITSCSLFKDSTKTKVKTTLDSVGSTKIKTKLVDTGSFKNYERISFYFAPGEAPSDQESIYDFAYGLRNAANNLASASQNLQDSTHGKPADKRNPKLKAKHKVSTLPGLMAAIWEKGSQGKKGISEDRNETKKSDLNKSSNEVDTEDKASPKAAAIFGVLAIFATAIVCLFVFLFIKSRK